MHVPAPKRRPVSSIALAIVATVGALIAVPALASKDRNGDRIPDRWEQRHDLSLPAHHLALATARVEQIAQAIADQVKAQHAQG